MCFACISILLLLPNLKEIPKGSYFTEKELIKGIPVTSETGRVHAGCASFEYLPNKAFENRKYIETRENVPIILDSENDEQINDFTKDGTNAEFKISKSGEKENIEIELPYIYYIGYNVQYADEGGNLHKVETYESENGFLCINVPNENITVNVKYTGTLLMKIAYIISAVTVLVLIIIYFIKRVKERKQKII